MFEKLGSFVSMVNFVKWKVSFFFGKSILKEDDRTE